MIVFEPLFIAATAALLAHDEHTRCGHGAGERKLRGLGRPHAPHSGGVLAEGGAAAAAQSRSQAAAAASVLPSVPPSVPPSVLVALRSALSTAEDGPAARPSHCTGSPTAWSGGAAGSLDVASTKAEMAAHSSLRVAEATQPVTGQSADAPPLKTTLDNSSKHDPPAHTQRFNQHRTLRHATVALNTLPCSSESAQRMDSFAACVDDKNQPHAFERRPQKAPATQGCAQLRHTRTQWVATGHASDGQSDRNTPIT